MYVGLLFPEKPSSSSIRKDWRIASEAKEKMDRKSIVMQADIIPATTVVGIGEVIPISATSFVRNT